MQDTIQHQFWYLVSDPSDKHHSSYRIYSREISSLREKFIGQTNHKQIQFYRINTSLAFGSGRNFVKTNTKTGSWKSRSLLEYGTRQILVIQPLQQSDTKLHTCMTRTVNSILPVILLLLICLRVSYMPLTDSSLKWPSISSMCRVGC